MKFISKLVTFLFLITLFLSLKAQASGGQWQAARLYDFQGILSYKFFVPEQLSDSPAILLGLHGCMQGPDAFSQGADLEKMAKESGSILVVPNQPEFSNIYKCWNWFYPHHLHGLGEAHLLTQITRQLQRQYQTKRAFVFGISAGAAMTQILATCYSDLFSASASHHALSFGAALGPWDAQDVFYEGPARSALESAKLAENCRSRVRTKTRQQVPALIIQGTKGQMSAQYGPTLEQQWLHFNDLRDNGKLDDSLELRLSEKRVELPGLYPYESRVWFTQKNRPLIQHIKIDGLGHSWSGGDNSFDFNDPHGPKASQLILEFFRHWGL